MMQPSTSSTPNINAEKLELERMWSDLDALKKLYGLLHKRENDEENIRGESEDWLDEKSKAFLAKLLDEAAQRALRRQAKMLSCALLTPSLGLAQRRQHSDRASDRAVEEVATLDYHRQRRRPVKESTWTVVKASPSQPLGAEPKMDQNPSPSREGLRLSKRLESPRSAISRHGRERTCRPHLRPPAKPHAAAAAGYRSGGPAHKRSRVEPEADRPGRTPGRARTDRRTRPELAQAESAGLSKETRAKEREEGARGPEVKGALRVPRRFGSQSSGRLREETGGPGRTVQISRTKKRADHDRAVEGKEIATFSSGRRLATPEKPPSHEKPVDRAGSRRTNRPPRIPSQGKSSDRFCSSSCSGARSDSGSSLGTTGTAESDSSRSTERMSASAPTRKSKHRGAVLGPIVPHRTTSPRPEAPSRAAPTRHHTSKERRRRRPPETAKVGRRKKQADQREGRLRRLKNKLAIVFHHHHHHHHHHQGRADGDSSVQEEEEEDGAHREHHHMSPWKNLRRMLRRTGDEEDRGRKPVMEARGERAADRVGPAHHQHGHVRALFEALLRHVWRTRRGRRRKAVRANRAGVGRSASRVRLRKLHWWQRLGRRGRGKLADSKKTPLRLVRN